MTDLTPLARTLHAKVWPFVSLSRRQRCETVDEENALMNAEVPRLAPVLLATPISILASVWGVHPLEADAWCREIRAALVAEER